MKPIAAAIRTIVQVLASTGFTAAVNAAAGGLPGNYKAAVLGLTIPATVWAHRALEDSGLIGTWLRQPSPSPRALQRQADKAAAAAKEEADRLAAQAAKAAPLIEPIVAQFQAIVDQALVGVNGRIDGILGQLPVTNLGPSPAPVVTVPPPSAPLLPTG